MILINGLKGTNIYLTELETSFHLINHRIIVPSFEEMGSQTKISHHLR
jgi:hypothetical protein